MDFMVLGWVKLLGRWLGWTVKLNCPSADVSPWWIKFAWSIIWRGGVVVGTWNYRCFQEPPPNQVIVHNLGIVAEKNQKANVCWLFMIMLFSIDSVEIWAIYCISYIIDYLQRLYQRYRNISWSIQYHLAVIWRCPIEPARCRRAEGVKERPAEAAGPTG